MYKKTKRGEKESNIYEKKRQIHIYLFLAI